MAGTVYILLALTAILTISNTSAESQDGLTQKELDSLVDELINKPKEVVKFLKKLAGFLKPFENKVETNVIKEFLNSMDAVLSELVKMDDKTDKEKSVVKLKLAKLLTDMESLLNVQDLAKQLVQNQPKATLNQLVQILEALRDISKQIVNKPKILPKFLKELDLTLEDLNNMINILDKLEQKKPDHQKSVPDSAASATAALAVVAAGLLASLPLNMVA